MEGGNQPMTASRRRSPEQGLAVRDRLLEAAARLFSERGYAATSVGAICEQADVGKPALYWHFDSKEGLLAAVLATMSSRRIDSVRKHAAEATTAGQRLHHMVEGMRRLVLEEPQLLRLPTLAALEQGAESEAIRRAVIDIWDRSGEALVADMMAATGRDADELKGVSFVALGLLSAASVRFSIDGDVQRLDRSLSAMESAVRALLADPPEDVS
jgi:AcrR family transcriptional regulator